jgi:hypothetical protein
MLSWCKARAPPQTFPSSSPASLKKNRPADSKEISMSSPVDIARALKDKDYFNSLTPDQQEMVRKEGGVGDANITDDALESVSGGDEIVDATGTDSIQGGGGGVGALVICNC